MSPSPSNSGNDDVPASAPQVTPLKGGGYGHPEYNFVQGLMELNGSVARMQAVLEDVKKSSDETKSKVSKLEKVIYAATVVLVIAVGVGGWMLNAAKDFAMAYYKASVDMQLKLATPPSPPPTTGGKPKP